MKKETLIKQLLQKDHIILAIDGSCASGKTTLAYELHDILGGNLFHMDDFFLPIEKRTKDRYEEPGGNVDYERFLATVLLPTYQKMDVYYQPFDCTTMKIAEGKQVAYHPITIIEGSYSLHPTLKDYYTDCIVLDIPNKLQLQRLKIRNPDNFDDFVKRWIPLEELYFNHYRIKELYPILEIE